MKANNRAIMQNDGAQFDSTWIVGLAVAVVVLAVVLPIAAGQLATAQANSSVTSLGIAPFMVVIAIVFIAAALYGLSRQHTQ